MSVACPPAPEHGIHSWLMAAANKLRHHHQPTAVAQIIAEQCLGARRHVPGSEIQSAVRKAFSDIGKPTGAFTMPPHFPTPASKWPAVDTADRDRVIGSGFGLGDLWESSPVRQAEDGPGASELLDALFPPDALL